MSGFSNNTGTPLPTDQAWRLIDGWKTAAKELGVWVAGSTASVSGVGAITAVRSGRIDLAGASWSLRLNLRDADFRYGPMTTWPRWPAPPMVDIIALQAMVGERNWVVLAEGWRPASLPP